MPIWSTKTAIADDAVHRHHWTSTVEQKMWRGRFFLSNKAKCMSYCNTKDLSPVRTTSHHEPGCFFFKRGEMAISGMKSYKENKQQFSAGFGQLEEKCKGALGLNLHRLASFKDFPLWNQSTKLDSSTYRHIGSHVDVLDFTTAAITADAVQHHHIGTSTSAPLVEEVKLSEVFVDGDAAVSPQSWWMLDSLLLTLVSLLLVAGSVHNVVAYSRVVDWCSLWRGCWFSEMMISVWKLI